MTKNSKFSASVNYKYSLDSHKNSNKNYTMKITGNVFVVKTEA